VRTTKTTTVAALVTAGAIAAAAVAGPAGAGQAHQTKIKCTVHLAAQASFPPPPNQQTTDFGQVTCNGPFGFGSRYDTFVDHPQSQTEGFANLKFKDYFDRGRIDGTWLVRYVATPHENGPPDVNYTITVKFKGGTGAFKHARGSGTGTGHMTDFTIPRATFEFTATLTGI
jgi:hypothetical protein